MTEADMQRLHFPDEPVLTLDNHVVPVELCRPIRLLLAEIERLRAVVGNL